MTENSTQPRRLWYFPCCRRFWDGASVAPFTEASIMSEHVCAIFTTNGNEIEMGLKDMSLPPLTCTYRTAKARDWESS